MKNNKKIIFLDLDGVVSVPASAYSLNREKMELVKRLCDKTDAKIVITSSWRKRNVSDTIMYLTEIQKNEGEEPFLCPELIVGITKRWLAFELGYEKDHFRVPRGYEIAFWICENRLSVTDYVILDDENDMLLEQASHFVQIDGDKGITEEDVEKAIKILDSSF